MSIDRKAVCRLENVLAMLSSPNDGERANAAMMATRMLKELGLDWRGFTQRAFAGGEGQAERDGDSELDLSTLSFCDGADSRTGNALSCRACSTGIRNRSPKNSAGTFGRSFESMRQVSAQRSGPKGLAALS